MFKEWGFLITEMVWLLLLAALLGLLVGWIIWGRRAHVDTSGMDEMKAELEACRKASWDKDEALKAGEAETARLNAALAECQATGQEQASRMAALEATTGAATDSGDRDYDGDGVIEGTEEGSKPTTLDGPRDGKADDLKMIKGIGPKLEQLCNRLGFYHFDQVAAWTKDEIAWVDANLEGFKGRVSRDNWVEQAKVLATGGETEFSKRVEDGDVY